MLCYPHSSHWILRETLLRPVEVDAIHKSTSRRARCTTMLTGGFGYTATADPR